MDRVSRNLSIGLAARFAAVCAWAGLCAACSGNLTAGNVIVTQDRYDFMNCAQILGHRFGLAGREKELTDLIEKSDRSPGGFLVSAAAYRSELVTTQASRVAVERAARKNNCDAPQKK